MWHQDVTAKHQSRRTLASTKSFPGTSVFHKLRCWLVMSATLVWASCGGGSGQPVSPDSITIQADTITPATESVSLVVFGINRVPALVRFYLNELFLGDDTTGPDYALLVPRSQLPTTLDPFSRWRAEVVDSQGKVIASGSSPISINPFAPPVNADIRFSNLTEGETYAGVLLIRVEVLPNPQWVRLFLDESLLAESRVFPALFTVDSSRYSNGDHILTAVAGFGPDGTSSRNIRVSFVNAPSIEPVSWVRLSSPEPNGPLSGTILLHADASEDTVRVRFYVDGDLVWEDFEPDYNYALDTRSYSDGSHLIEACADFQNGGKHGVAIVVNFLNQPNPPPPPPPPPIRIDAPANNSTVSGPFTVVVSTPNPALIIEEVKFFVDGKEIGKKIFAPYQITVDPAMLRLPPGWHTILVAAEIELPDGMEVSSIELDSDEKFYASVRINYVPSGPPSL